MTQVLDPTSAAGSASPLQAHTDPEGELRALLARVPRPPIPTATYRLQFHPGFPFSAAREIVPYLHALGISHLYASPYLRARSGSTHGYDVADPTSLNPELGSQADYDALAAELASHHMGQVVDVVPNHMGIGDPSNYRWHDVLENGQSSIYAHFFDINWHPMKVELSDEGKVVLPTLGDQYGRVLENGELQVAYQNDELAVRYYDNCFPLAPDTYETVLWPCWTALVSRLGEAEPAVHALGELRAAFRDLPPRSSTEPDLMQRRHQEKEAAKRRFAELYKSSAEVRKTLEHVLADLNGRQGDPFSFDRLDALLGDQSYRLAFWRVAADEINYRRFFDINELVAVRVEDPTVFQETHRLLLGLVRTGQVTGMRVDHPDGLRDPTEYLWRLQRSAFAAYYEHAIEQTLNADDSPVATLRERLEALFDAERERDSTSPLLRSFYVVAEKILEQNETLRSGWPVAGTTGYDFLNVANGLFVDGANRESFQNLYARLTGATQRYGDLVNVTKKMIMLISLASEVNELGYLAKRLATADRRYWDFTLNSLTFAVREVVAGLPVYRTYVDPTAGCSTAVDVEAMQAALREAEKRNPRTDPSIFRFVSDMVFGTGDWEDRGNAYARHLQRVFSARFQQTTGPVMAKGAEDTAFYVYNRLAALNEVGGDPERFGVSPAAFHRFNAAHAHDWPNAMLASSTHDTKRSEDVRARLDVLSEIPHDWQAAVSRWSQMNAGKKTLVDGRAAPDRNEEYLLYQAILGIWPFHEPDDDELGSLRDRILAFMEKAIKEAKVNTSWIHPNTAYEEAMQRFVRGILDRSVDTRFLDEIQEMQHRLGRLGLYNSLSQTLLKLTSPGVPDVYQGNEVWDFSLVDPDNRRPVDFRARLDMLQSLRQQMEGPPDALPRLVTSLLDTLEDARAKLYVTHQMLLLRRRLPELFAHGSYQGLRVEGSERTHVCAFSRSLDGRSLVVAVPVLVGGLLRGTDDPPIGEALWGNTRLYGPAISERSYRNVLTGEVIRGERLASRICLPASRVFGLLPVAALLSEPD